MRFALAVEYAGHAFCGFQSQPSKCGVQDALQQALGAIAGHHDGLGAGGLHAARSDRHHPLARGEDVHARHGEEETADAAAAEHPVHYAPGAVTVGEPTAHGPKEA